MAKLNVGGSGNFTVELEGTGKDTVLVVRIPVAQGMPYSTKGSDKTPAKEMFIHGDINRERFDVPVLREKGFGASTLTVWFGTDKTSDKAQPKTMQKLV